MNGIYESYDDISERTLEYVDAWTEEETTNNKPKPTNNMNTTVMQMCETLKAQTRNDMKNELSDKLTARVDSIEKILYTDEALNLYNGSTGFRHDRMNLFRGMLGIKVMTYWNTISIIRKA